MTSKDRAELEKLRRALQRNDAELGTRLKPADLHLPRLAAARTLLSKIAS